MSILDGYFETKTKECVLRVSENTIDIEPTPVYVKVIEDAEKINNECYMMTEDMDLSSGEIDPSGALFTELLQFSTKNVLDTDNMYIQLLRKKITDGISEMISVIYSHKGEYKYKIENSWFQKTGAITPRKGGRMFTVAYFIEDEACISFLTRRNFNVRPKSGTLMIWEGDLTYFINSYKFVLFSNIIVEF